MRIALFSVTTYLGGENVNQHPSKTGGMGKAPKKGHESPFFFDRMNRISGYLKTQINPFKAFSGGTLI